MKIHTLEIRNFRGITSLKIEPNGKNFLISGPNGTGKSSVVDAIDFLMTGNIARLSGPGTKGITVKKYGAHLDNNDKPEETKVSALVSLNNSVPFNISRSMTSPEELEIANEDFRDQLNHALALAIEGQHILTRREILGYIATEPSNRAQRIQALLNLNRIEEMRLSIVKVHRHFKDQYSNKKANFETEESQVASLIQLPHFDDISLLNFVNVQRTLLGSEPLIKMNVERIRLGVQYDDARRKHIDDTVSIQTELENLRSFEKNYGNQLSQLNNELREILIRVIADPSFTQVLKKYELIELGIALLDDSGDCPLCDVHWEAPRLRLKLEAKRELGEEAKQYGEKISSLTKQLVALFNFLLSSLRRVIAIANQVGFSNKKTLQDWQQIVEKFKRDLDDLEMPYMHYSQDQITKGFMTPLLQETLVELESMMKSKSDLLSPEQLAYDNLIRLEQSLLNMGQARIENEAAGKKFEIVQELQKEFIASRDSILNSLYDQIKERFQEIYRRLHFEDEQNFTATLAPTNSGLNLEVEFHGHGHHPPLALHSEGHQDSMGLCLFLALAEKVARNRLNLIILDDVVMSVDAGHRKELCRVLGDVFQDFQIIIATHDKTWHQQLLREGIVNKDGTIEFLNWHIATGPTINSKNDIWEEIVEDLDKNNVPAAAAKLRRWGEMYFSEVCANLGAKVIFRQDGRWDLGELFHPAISAWKDLNRKTMKAEISWGANEKSKALDDLNKMFTTAITRLQSEQWIINSSVHYNDWANNLSKQDFQDVATAFRDLTSFFECEKCGGLLSLDRHIEPQTVRCQCTNISWNLQVASKESQKAAENILKDPQM